MGMVGFVIQITLVLKEVSISEMLGTHFCDVSVYTSLRELPKFLDLINKFGVSSSQMWN
jgi:hypothetical protein